MFAALKTYFYLQKPRKAKENDENTNKNNKRYNKKLMKTPLKPIKKYETTHENTNKTNNNYETTLIKTMKKLMKTPTTPIKTKDEKQDAAHEPECSHVCWWYRCRNTWICSYVEHFCESVYLNNLVHFSPVNIPLHRRLWNMEEGGLPNVECGV